jgi:hypothetical protein
MIRNLMMAASAVAVVLALGAPVAAAQERMREVGTLKFVPAPAEPRKGTIEVPREQSLMRTLELEVISGSADVKSMFLNYRDGTIERVRVDKTLREGQTSGIVRMPEKRLRSVEISYVPLGPVTFALNAESQRPPPPPAEWKELGCRNVGFLVDRDAITVTSSERFKALRLRASGFDIEMQELTVRFGDGTADNYRIQSVIPSGTRTSAIDLRGDRRRIRQIDLLYRSRVLSNIKTQLCVEGLTALPEGYEE